MHVYSVYFNPADSENEIVIVKDVNSFWAGIFNVFWAGYKKLWPAFIAALIITVSFEILETLGFPVLARSIELTLIASFYFFAHDIECYCLERNGYKLKDVILANSEDEVELRFLREFNNEPSENGVEYVR